MFASALHGAFAMHLINALSIILYKVCVHVYINTLQVSIANTNVLSIILYKFYVQHVYINALTSIISKLVIYLFNNAFVMAII